MVTRTKRRSSGAIAKSVCEFFIRPRYLGVMNPETSLSSPETKKERETNVGGGGFQLVCGMAADGQNGGAVEDTWVIF